MEVLPVVVQRLNQGQTAEEVITVCFSHQEIAADQEQQQPPEQQMKD